MALVGCGSTSDAAAGPTVARTPTLVSTPTSTPPTTTPPPTPAGPVLHKLGTTVATPDGHVDVTVYAFRQPVAAGAPRPDQRGYTWAGIDVKVCSHIEAIVNMLPWSLVYADDTRAESSSVGYRQFPLPSYAWGDTPLHVGRCLRGWIVFPVPAKTRPVMVEYQPEGTDATDWKV